MGRNRFLFEVSSAVIWKPRASLVTGSGFLYWVAVGLVVVIPAVVNDPLLSAEPPENGSPGAEPAPYRLRLLRGEVVWLADVLARQYGIRVVPEADERILVLKTPDGVLYPVIEDIRGRAFRADERLREKQLKLRVRQYAGSPLVQVVRVFEIDKTGSYELDYWCEICAIAMFELKVCDCCQGPVNLRRRPVSRQE